MPFILASSLLKIFLEDNLLLSLWTLPIYLIEFVTLLYIEFYLEWVPVLIFDFVGSLPYSKTYPCLLRFSCAGSSLSQSICVCVCVAFSFSAFLSESLTFASKSPWEPPVQSRVSLVQLLPPSEVLGIWQVQSGSAQVAQAVDLLLSRRRLWL